MESLKPGDWVRLVGKGLNVSASFVENSPEEYVYAFYIDGNRQKKVHFHVSDFKHKSNEDTPELHGHLIEATIQDKTCLPTPRSKKELQKPHWTVPTLKNTLKKQKVAFHASDRKLVLCQRLLQHLASDRKLHSTSVRKIDQLPRVAFFSYGLHSLDSIRRVTYNDQLSAHVAFVEHHEIFFSGRSRTFQCGKVGIRHMKDRSVRGFIVYLSQKELWHLEKHVRYRNDDGSIDSNAPYKTHAFAGVQLADTLELVFNVKYFQNTADENDINPPSAAYIDILHRNLQSVLPDYSIPLSD